MLAAQFVRFLANLVGIIVLARLLSPTDYGLVTMVTAVVGIAEIFRDFGLANSALRAKELSHDQQSNLFWINTSIGFVMSVLCFVCAPLVASFYDQDALVLIMQAVSVVFLLNGISTQFRVAINRQLRFTALTLSDLLPTLFGVSVSIFVAVITHNYWALVIQQIVIAAGIMIYSAIASRWWPGLPNRRGQVGELVGFGFNLAGTQMMSYITRNVDSIGIGRVWGASDLGFYDRAYKFLMLPLNQINAPLSKVAIPVLSKLESDEARYERYVRHSQLVACYVTATLFAVLAALSPAVITVLLGPGWDLTGQLFAVLAIGGIFRSILQICYWIYVSKGLAKEQLRFYLVAQPLLALTILSGLPWGPLGVAIMHSIGYALLWVVSLWWVGRKSGIKTGVLFVDAARAVGLVAGVSGVAAYFASQLSSVPLLQILFGGLAAALWCVVAWLLFPAVRKDVKVLAEFGSRAIGRKM